LNGETRLIGIENVTKKFAIVAKAIDRAGKESILKQAQFIRDRIREKAPQGETGNLKRSVIAKVLPERANWPHLAIAGIDRKIAPHAGLVEYGHAGPHPAPPHPFFRPAVAECMDIAEKNIEKDVQGGIAKVT
jgi:HK97 gp10 family phage protein